MGTDINNIITEIYSHTNDNIEIYYTSSIQLSAFKDGTFGTLSPNKPLLNFIKSNYTLQQKTKVIQYQFNDILKIIESNNTKKVISIDTINSWFYNNFLITITEEAIIHENKFPIINKYNNVSNLTIEKYTLHDIEIDVVYEKTYYHLQIRINNNTPINEKNFLILMQQIFHPEK